VCQRIDQPHRPAHHALQVHGGGSMCSLSDSDKEEVRHESAISSLRNRTGAPLAEVRSLFAQEFSRLELGAKVRSYLSVLTVSNVRTMLRRKGA
jgi:predicted ThiF/HesA family dinucleotide-utilizing enzyme